MKKMYISPITEKVRFDNGTDTLKFTDLTDASNAGGPGTKAPSRSAAPSNSGGVGLPAM